MEMVVFVRWNQMQIMVVLILDTLTRKNLISNVGPVTFRVYF